MGDVVPESTLATRLSNPKETDEVYDFGGVSIKGRHRHICVPRSVCCGTTLSP
ncbi:Hypothetical protein FKW44_017286 [Caligus rogercresseyi]|uniref:Uncharacterized protein n=1 Tax=Caligus rogercresseyi TaxID=217165 RepID=A0A7T8JX38_CALRO|nr:Hypothetical protein FKW44_017286 [Caligus rogercresseyi]